MKTWKQIRESEPVRVWVYPVLLVVLGIAVKQGVVDADTESLVQLVLVAVLGVGGVEAVRGRVSPVRAAQHELVNTAPTYEIPGFEPDENHVPEHARTDVIPVVTEDR